MIAWAGVMTVIVLAVAVAILIKRRSGSSSDLESVIISQPTEIASSTGPEPTDEEHAQIHS